LQVKEIKIKVILYNLSRLILTISLLIFIEGFYRAEKPQIEIITDLNLDWQQGEVTAFRNLIVARNIGTKPVIFSSAYIGEFIETERHWWEHFFLNNEKEYHR
ncbi:MAG: hypothetical protein WCB46_04220, partial [Methanoregula sp.]